MSFWAFLYAVARHALHHGFERAHLIHTAIVIGSGAAALLLWQHHGEESLMIVAVPFVVFIVALAFGFVRHAYALYREEYDRRTSLERNHAREVAELSGQLGDRLDRQAVRAELNQIIEAGVQLQLRLHQASNSPDLAALQPQFEDWIRNAAAFVRRNYPDYSGHFQSDAGFAEHEHQARTLPLAAVNFLNRRLQRLSELLERG
jgi:hypothetical protein